MQQLHEEDYMNSFDVGNNGCLACQNCKCFNVFNNIENIETSSIIDPIYCPQYLSDPPERSTEQLELPIQSILTFASQLMPASPAILTKHGEEHGGHNLWPKRQKQQQRPCLASDHLLHLKSVFPFKAGQRKYLSGLNIPGKKAFVKFETLAIA